MSGECISEKSWGGMSRHGLRKCYYLPFCVKRRPSYPPVTFAGNYSFLPEKGGSEVAKGSTCCFTHMVTHVAGRSCLTHQPWGPSEL